MEKTRTLLILFISVIVLFKLYLFPPLSVYNPSPIQSHEDLDKHVWPLLYSNDVVPLNGKNFSNFMGKNRYVMVMFYADWCYWSKQLAPEFAATAKLLKGEAELAMVNAYVEKELAKKHDVQGYPTIYLFFGGVRQYQYLNERKRDIMSAWVRRKIDIGTYSITTMDEAERILAAESKLVLGFLDDLKGPETEELAAASKQHSDINFYQTASADVAELFHIDPKIKRPALIFLRVVAGNASMFYGQYTRFAIADFVSNVKHPQVVTLTMRNAKVVFHNPMKQLWLFAPGYGSQEVISTFEEVVEVFKGKLLPVYVEMNSEGIAKRVSHEFGITGNTPRVIAYSTGDGKKYLLDGELTLSSIKSFGEDFLGDKLLIQSDQISETNLELPSNSRVSYQLRSHV